MTITELEAVCEANRHMLKVHYHQLGAHFDRTSPAFMGYTAIPTSCVLRTISMLDAPSSLQPLALQNAWRPLHAYITTFRQAREALDTDNFMAELQSWAESEEQC